jgi:hypothetical protein
MAPIGFKKPVALFLFMRGIFILAVLLSGLFLAGCSQPTPPANDTNGTLTPPVDECIGPVCGTDGVTYATDCEAVLANATADYMGECMEDAAPCTDSDGGQDTETAGYSKKGDIRFDDRCAADGKLQESVCQDGEASSVLLECGLGKECSEGRCIIAPATEPPPVVEPPQTGCSGPFEADILVKGTVNINGSTYTDTCIEFSVVKDYFCKDGNLAAINHECPAGYGCNMGKCELQPFICSETDNGNDTQNRSRTLVTKGLNVAFDKTDECIDIATLKEHYCMPDGTAATEEITCASGTKCVLGKCVKSKCSETDGGFNIYKRGITTAGDVEKEDECLSDFDIQEYYCYGDEVQYEVESCGSGYICSSTNSKCVEGSVD